MPKGTVTSSECELDGALLFMCILVFCAMHVFEVYVCMYIYVCMWLQKNFQLQNTDKRVYAQAKVRIKGTASIPMNY